MVPDKTASSCSSRELAVRDVFNTDRILQLTDCAELSLFLPYQPQEPLVPSHEAL
jgi:hypothetical protein